MKDKIALISVFLCAFGYLTIAGSEWNDFSSFIEDNMIDTYERKETSKLSNDTFYCYHFTWMGDKFNNRTFKNIRNKTCNQYFKDKKTLCINPMVATFEGGEPDINYIREKHPIEATCRLSKDQVCVKYTVYYNGITSYQTRYCTRVNVEAEAPMESGCVFEKNGNQMIEVCACRSERGPLGICNSAEKLLKNNVLVWFLLLTVIYTFYRDKGNILI